MYLILEVHSSNECCDTPDFAVVEWSAALQQRLQALIAQVQGLKQQQALDTLYMLELFDYEAAYLQEARCLFPEEYGEVEDCEESPELLTVSGESAWQMLMDTGVAFVETLPPRFNDPESWSRVDCPTLHVTTDCVRWSACWGEGVTLTTHDLSLRAIADQGGAK